MARRIRPRHGEIARHDLRDSRAIELLTSLWVLATLTTAACEILAIATATILLRSAASLERDALMRRQALLSILLGGALVLGLVSLALLAAVIRLRQVPPDRGVVGLTLLIDIAPWVLCALSLAQ